MRNLLNVFIASGSSLLMTCYATHSLAQGTPIPELKPVVYTDIKGAIKLEQPRFLTDTNGEMLFVEKAGHSYPALFDWNNDGKRDLLIGEFAGGKNSNIMVFENIGSNKKPKYSGESYYALDNNNEKLYVSGY